MASLVTALKQGDPATQRTVLSALGSLGGPEAERAITEVAAKGSPEARQAAVQSLVQLGADATGSLEKLAHSNT